MNELWRPVDGYVGAYEVSSEGRVRSLDRRAINGRRLAGRILAQSIRKKDGYHQVSLTADGHQRSRLVHVLVLEAFVGARPEGLDACHNDGNPSKNTPGNLRWDTRSANVLDQVTHGTNVNAAKVRCKHGHEFTESNTYVWRGWRMCRTCRRNADGRRK
ncbi:NUMOD4 motif-containing HNH endonuclease [Microbacterium sp. T32]|uniref:NUMOD4 motif-containing HNH endonuclease n=1 Tax=Microbacterium sp. T32 TaxID=1776083 RepID=UPI0009EECE84